MSIYGANASGKSNLVSAFVFFQAIVVNSFNSGSYPLFCKVIEDYKEQPTTFEIKILINGKVLVYGFQAIMFKSFFTKEWLYEELQNGTKKYVFTRDIPNGEFILGEYISIKNHIERLNIYGEDIKFDNSVLFLRLMNQNKTSLYEKNSKICVFRDVYLWIKNKLDVNSPESPITNYSVLNDAEGIDKITRKLSEFATGVVKFDIVPISEEKITANLPNDMINEIKQRLLEQKKQLQELPSDYKPTVLIRMSDGSKMYIIELNEEGTLNFKTMSFKHKNSDSIFSLDDESDGTIRLLDIIEVLLTAEEEKVYIIDEINRKFHPLLTRKFVEEFLELAKDRNIQLIVTTHESQLMDLSLLRRDEINFVNKDENGYSTIYSLDDYDVRFDKKVVTEYLKGHYKAIPIWN